MRVILSRKGFDSEYGKTASPILHDGTLLSLPIPYDKGKTYNYSEMYCKSLGNKSYETIIRELIGDKRYENYTQSLGGHTDPDLRQIIHESLPDDRSAVFGQCGGAVSHLLNPYGIKENGVKKNDLFLFFGWFRETEYENEKLQYKESDSDGRHIIYGYLQVGEMIIREKDDGKDKFEKYKWHPHYANFKKEEKEKHCLFIARDKLSWKTKLGDNIPSFGVFTYNENNECDKQLILTKDGASKRYWRLPEIWGPDNKPKISYHMGEETKYWILDDDLSECFKSACKGQEFIILDKSVAVENWAKSIIENQYYKNNIR